MYFIGVDGGGTKTQTIISDQNGNVLGISKVGATYLHSIDEDTLYKTLEDGILRALADSGLKSIEVSKSCFGIAGLDSPHDGALLQRAVKRINSVKLDNNPLCVNDVATALRRGTDQDHGLVVIAGTGSNCYGKNKRGDEAFAGGLGHVLSDEGGSYYIGQRVLHAASKSYDGRADKTLLEELMYENYGVVDMREMIIKVHQPGFGKTQIASLAFICEKAAANGDKTALQILLDGAKELICMVATVNRKININSEPFNLVCVGGAFNKTNGPGRLYFEEHCKKEFSNATLVFPQNEPALGAALLAIDKYKATSK